MKSKTKEIPHIPNIEKFLSRISIVDKCWIWTGEINHKGYGELSLKSSVGKWSRYRAHRISFEIFNGKLDPELVIDHECMNKSCVNPDHLRQVVQGINNTENSSSMGAVNKIKTHCPQGHEYTEDNIYPSKVIWRACLKCRQIRNRKTGLKQIEELKGEK